MTGVQTCALPIYTYPYGMDDKDSNIRIAPTFTSDEDLEAALQILVCCIKVACLTKLSSK